ncbi:hypothetical protein Lfu02_78900 [Longispora fulva]|uniref:RHS repeat-associated protein n=1 Tax=Longispora fulva TaxID=619741 RepID=A0A8J7G9A5_9ACTN|nr:RHS repeat-associated core domain-containing protein [Longispora fulva]MBG6134019.1 RHS repeat-associated protein [Longispora fulva]GIG63518.1 hypothetical protein Lfu02_78900 [Longispora fulva]
MALVLSATLLTVVPPSPAAAAKPKPVALVVERADAVSASMAARKQGKRVEVLDSRTETSQTFANPNGSFSLEQHVQPVWARKGSGWAPVDTTLIQAPDGSIVPKAQPAGVRLSAGSPAAAAGVAADAPQDLITVGSGGDAVTLAWRGRLPKPTLSGDTATYASVLPGVDLLVQATRTGFEQFLVLSHAPGQSVSFTLPMRSKGLTAAARADGGLDFTNAAGRIVGSMPPATMWDARKDQKTGLPAHQGPVRLSATSREGALDLTYTADAAFLATADYPVTIDPATSLGRTHWLLASASEPDRTYYDSDNTARAGTPDDGTHAFRSFFAFDPSSLAGKHVQSATLNTNETHSWTCTATPVELWDAGSFTSSSTWANQPALGTKLGTQTVAHGYNASCPAANVAWNVTSAVQGWATANAAVGTLALRAPSETDPTQWKWFDNNPSLSVTYNSYPSVPSALSVTPSVMTAGTLYTNTPTPVLSATATDADGGNLSFTYQVQVASTIVATGTVGGVASGGTASWTPSGLGNGPYTWRVQASDGTDSGPWSAWQAVTVNATIAAAPTVACAGYPANAWTAVIAGGTGCSFSDVSTDVTGYLWGLDQNPPATYTAASTATVNPGPGLHTLYVQAQNSAGNRSGATSYTFGVGSAGVNEPADQSTTSATVNLRATAPTGASAVRFQYRIGTTGAFTDVPVADVTPAITWPVATTATAGGVTSPTLVWNAARSLAGDGPVQIQAVFTTSGGSVTSPPVTTVLQRNAIGSDFASAQVGPVSVGLQSGNAALSASDVSVASYRSGLGVARTFNSLAPAVPSMFGPGWTSSLPVLGTSAAWSALVDNGSYALLTGADGSTRTFNQGTTSNGVTGYLPQGAAATTGLVLTKSSSGFLLVDSTTTQVRFTAPDSAKPTRFVPSLVTQPGTGRSTGYTYSGGKLALITAPDPVVADDTATTAACAYPVASSTWSAGCRGLTFQYDPTTGNISEVDFVAVENTAGFQQIPVARYTYDSSGRLVAEWDPRISPALKNQYTYDSNGRLASVSPAQDPATGNLKPFTFTYDNTPGSLDYGKLLKVTRTHSDNTAAVQTVVYRVPLTKAAGGPIDMDPATTAAWGQTDTPTSAVAVFPADHQPGQTIDWTWADITYYDANGRAVNTAGYGNGWHVTTTEHDTTGNVIRELSAANRETALGGTTTPANPAYVARVASHTGTSTLTSLTVPVTAPVTAGDALVVSLMLTNTANNTVAGNVAVTDSQGDTFTVVTDTNDGSAKDRTLVLAAFGVHTLTTSDTLTVTFPSTGEHHLAVDELSGVNGVDQKSAATGAAGTNFNSGNTPTTTAPNELVFAAAGIQGGSNATWGSGFIALPTVFVSSDQLATAYRTVTATGAYNASGTATKSWMASAVTFRAGANTAAIAQQLDTENIYSADGMELLDSYGPLHAAAVTGYAQPQQVRTHRHSIYDEGAPSTGGPYRLVTTDTETASLGSAIPGTDIDARTTRKVYGIGSDNTGWTLHSPLQTVIDPSGLVITRTTVYNSDPSLYKGEPLAVESRMPANASGGGAGTTRTIHYTAGSNPQDASCGNQPNWADLVCKTTPVAQPGTAGLPNLPVTSHTYNIDLQPVTVIEDFGGGNTRTSTSSYDSAGRLVRTSVVAAGTGSGTPIQDTVSVYSVATGLLTDTETVDGSNAVTADLKSGYDEFGRVSTYSDADGTSTTTTYDLANRIATTNDGLGTRTHTYNGGNERRGLLTGLTDSQAGTFTGTYDADKELTTEQYPGGITATRSFNPAGTATGLSYASAAWSGPIGDSMVPNGHGDLASHAGLNASQIYTYDAASRLTQVADTAAGNCTTRGYGYDANSNRTGETTWAAATNGGCQTATATANRTRSYDSADRLTDSGYGYDAFGRITTTVAADAGGQNLTSTYYANDLAAGQAQNGRTVTWTLDPAADRVRTSTDSATGVTTTNHYGCACDKPSWTGDSAGHSTRNVSGINDLLSAQVNAGVTTLQLVNLHGDVMAAANTNGTDPGPTATMTYTEFGAVESGNPGQYGWLGGEQRQTTTLGGQILMGVRVYAPALGRFLQIDPIPGGSANAYEYGGQDPVNNVDLDGRCPWCDIINHFLQGYFQNQAAGVPHASVAKSDAGKAAYGWMRSGFGGRWGGGRTPYNKG